MAIETITKDIKVDGQLVEAEYLHFERSNWLEKWTLLDKLTIPFYRLRGHIRELRHIIKWSFQRMFRGYDDTETFEMYNTFITRYKKILTQYRNTHYGYPTDLTEEEWDSIVDRMIHCLDMMDESYVSDVLRKNMPGDYVPSMKSVSEITERYKNEFFEMFSNWFYNLWD